MTHKLYTHILTFLMALLLAVTAGSAAFAQKEDKKVKPKPVPNKIEKGKPYTKATKGSWKVECQKDILKSPEGKNLKEREACVVMQDAASAKDKRVVSNVLVFSGRKKDKDGKIVPVNSFQIITPTGVLLPVGLAIELDGKAIGRFQYIQCVKGRCIANAPIDAKLLKQLHTSKEMKIHVRFPQVNYPVKIKMKSLKEALAVRDKVHAANK